MKRVYYIKKYFKLKYLGCYNINIKKIFKKFLYDFYNVY